MKKVEKDILGTTFDYFLRDVFPILVLGKSKGLNHLTVCDKGISYLGATNLNNGVLDFVSPVEKQVQKAILCYLHQIQNRHRP